MLIKTLTKLHTFEEKADLSDGNEYGLVVNISKNTISDIKKGKPRFVNPLTEDYGDDELYVIHNHNNNSPPSPKDIGKLLSSSEKY